MTGLAAPIRRFFDLIRFEHTLFALPWALAGMIVAARGWPRIEVVLWILVAMVGARTAAMTFNRLVDRRFDRENPRTKMRHSATGVIGPGFMTLATVVASAIFFFAAWRLNRLAFLLAAPTLLLLLLYSVTKRIFAWTHVVLGIALGLSPLGAWVAVRGTLDHAALPALFLTLAVTAWTTGFDILYACQDLAFDRSHGLHSVPARFGMNGAFLIARIAHALVPVALFFSGRTGALGPVFDAVTVVVLLLLIYEHRLVRADDLSRLNQAFFNVNVMIAFLVLSGVAVAFITGSAR